MKQSPYLKPLFWTLQCFLLAVCLVLILLVPMLGILILFAVLLTLLLLILLKPGFWDRVRPNWKFRRKKKQDEEVPGVERTFQAVMMLESCAEGDTEMIRITSPEFTLGRGGDNDHVFVGKPSISGHHARITFREEMNFYYIEDLGSRNGTFVNARRLNPRTPALLKEKTVVAFDQYRYIFRRIGR